MNVVEQNIYNKVLKGIDTDALAKELAPQITAELKKNILMYIKDNIQDCIYDSNFNKLIGQQSYMIFEKAMGVTKPTKKVIK